MNANQVFRHTVLWGMLLVTAGVLCWRLSHLHTIEDDFLKVQGDQRSIRTIPIQSFRGMLLDRNGEPLAVSSPVASVFANPQQMDSTNPKLLQLVKLLGLNQKQTRALTDKSKSFVYLKRHISPVLAKQVKQLDVEGIHFQREYRRFYPTAEVAAHVVGRTGVDHNGLEGLELAFDHRLAGSSGKKTVLKDRLGAQIESITTDSAAKKGEDIYLSLDSRLQYLAYREIYKAVKQHGAKSGTIVVLDAKTSEVLAMANAPSFNPNQVTKGFTQALKNRAVTDQFEPGSVVKPISMAHILSSGDYYPHTVIDTSPGFLKIGNKTVKDNKNHGQMDLGTVLKKSSNVGISKLLLSLPAQDLYDTFHDLGFGTTTGSNFPGEAKGHIQYDGQHNPFVLATLGFGYGISATPLQIASAYATIASGGIKRPVSFVKQSKPTGHEVISPSVASMVTEMLVRTTQVDGTAFKASVPGYTIAGKTGTARKIGPNGYTEDSHLALFAGFAPAHNPEIVIAVVIDEPSSGHYYGGQVAAPVFSRVMAGALRLFDVEPFGSNQEYLLVKK